MDLIKILRDNGYDYIEGITRQHKPLQIWRKRSFNEVEYASDHISHVFKSDVILTEEINAALNVDYTHKINHKFNLGLTALDNILSALGIGALSLSAEFDWGKSLSISFSDTISKEYPIIDIDNYLYSADLRHSNPQVLKDLNKENMLLITGILYAKNFKAQLSDEKVISVELEASIMELVEGKLTYERSSESSITLSASTNSFFPIAVKSSKLVFQNGLFKKTIPVGDNYPGLF